MPDDGAMVYVVDDDRSVRQGLDSLLRSVGYEVGSFASADELRLDERGDGPACMVLDVRMPGLSGLDYHARLAARGIVIPTIFLTGHGDVPMCAQAMKAGAVDFLLKPFREQDLLDAIGVAIDKDRLARRDEAALRGLRDRFGTLTPREREVVALAATGRLNRQIAAELGLSEITIKVSRGHAMRKMEAGSFAELVRMAERLGMKGTADHGPPPGSVAAEQVSA